MHSNEEQIYLADGEGNKLLPLEPFEGSIEYESEGIADNMKPNADTGYFVVIYEEGYGELVAIHKTYQGAIESQQNLPQDADVEIFPIDLHE